MCEGIPFLRAIELAEQQRVKNMQLGSGGHTSCSGDVHPRAAPLVVQRDNLSKECRTHTLAHDNPRSRWCS